MSGKRYPWPTIVADYVEGATDAEGRLSFPSCRDLAAKYGARVETVEDRCTRDGWVEQRAVFQRRVEEQRQDDRINEIGRIAADLDLTALQLARDGLSITRARVQELGITAQRRIGALQAGVDPVQFPPVDAQEMDRLSRSADTWYLLATKAIGLAPHQVVEIELVEPITEDERDRRTLGVMAILREHVPELLPPELEDVIDVDAGRLQVVAAPGESGDDRDVHAEDQQLHPADADDG